jgi:large subunit ribosomal protein L15
MPETPEFTRTVSRPPPNAPVTPRVTIPRWKAAPAGLHLPFKIRNADGKPAWRCNDDALLLNRMYVRLLGSRGPTLLKDETKWLAVTHKTFDQGKRGFNERLAFYGMR